MPVSHLVAVHDSRHRNLIRGVDARGQVWVHHNPVELYRFIRARNQLLATIATGSR